MKTFVKNKLLTLETASVNVYPQDKGDSWFPQGGGRGSHRKWSVTEMPGPKCEVKTAGGKAVRVQQRYQLGSEQQEGSSDDLWEKERRIF